MLLEVQGLDVRYGRTHALKEFDLSIETGEIVTVLGANGAGKSTLLKALQGTAKSAGKVLFGGRNISNWSAPQRVREGMVLVPEGRQIFVTMTVEENLQMGAYCRRSDIDSEIEAIYEQFPNLAERRHMLAAVLSGGEQQMLAISRALLAKPKLMMLDEPSLGLSPLLVQHLFKLIDQLNRDGLTILLVEQNTRMALLTAHRGYVLQLGRCVLDGTTEALANDARLERAYLGGTMDTDDPAVAVT